MSAEPYRPPAWTPEDDAELVSFPGTRGESQPTNPEAESEQTLWEQFEAFAKDPNQPRHEFERQAASADITEAREHSEWRRTSNKETLTPVDFAHLDKADTRNLTLVIHRFAARNGHAARLKTGILRFHTETSDAYEEHNSSDTQPPMPPAARSATISLLSVPESSIVSTVTQFYKQHGNDLHPRDSVRQRNIDAFLRAAAITNDDVHVYEGDPKYAVSRRDIYPEFRIAEELMEQFDLLGYDKAADAAEVLLAAYGTRILRFAAMAGRQLMQDRQTRRYQPIDESSIPDEFKAERERRPRQ